MPNIYTEDEIRKEGQALAGLKFLEFVWSLACFTIQVVGLLDKREPFPHEYPVAISYAAFTLISLCSTVIQLCCCMNRPVSYRFEAALSFAGFLTFLACGFRAMYNVEVDIHMRHLTDREESVHAFFVRNRLQSIVSNQAAGLFLVHGVLMLDLLGVLDRRAVSVVDQVENRLRLVPLWDPVWGWITGRSRRRSSESSVGGAL